MSVTPMVTVSDASAPVKLRVMVYLVAAEGAFGVPEISPVEVFSERVAGRAGDTEYEPPEPITPETVLAAIAEFCG